MKTILALILLATGLNVQAARSTSKVKVTTRLYLCNQVEYSYCHQTATWGQGYGRIDIKGSRYDVRPGGRNAHEASIMVGKMKAFIALESLAPQNRKKFFTSSPFLATGYFGLDPVSHQIIFYLTKMEQVSSR